MTVWMTSHFPETIDSTTKQMRITLPAKAVLAYSGHICERGHVCDRDNISTQAELSVPLSASCIWDYRSALVAIYRINLMELELQLNMDPGGDEKSTNSLKKRGLMKVNEGKLQLKASLIAALFDANDLFDTTLSTINTALKLIFDLLKPLVGEKSASPKASTRSADDMIRSLPALILEDQTGTSSHNESPADEADTDCANDPPRMTLRSSRAAMLRQREDQDVKQTMNAVMTTFAQDPTAKLESHFQAVRN
ncbi:Hypothetical protein PHPALM_18412 [Phytophthora palmivora]|uniref:Uncharacterized protein n=1 Tax=Phytophthora palmivora TaxID=4796 RepID=A0A2P4XK03_9STRA|nr:Hypothetical protein PHPALM_18412 [Phytophthora palmivora]